MTAGRELALLTNPTAGKGKGARTAAMALPRLLEAGYDVRSLAGRSPEEALDLARQCVADGIEALVVCGGDGMVHLGVQAVAGTDTPLGIIPAGTGNDVARYLDLPRSDPALAADVVARGKERVIDLARVGSVYFVTVLAAGFDAIVNERANAMTWPKGQMRYNLATLAELRVLAPIPYVLELDGVEERLEATLVAVGNGPVVRWRTADHRGRGARRRDARRRGDQAAEQAGPAAHLPQAVQGHARPPPAVPAPPGAAGDRRRPRDRRLR